MRCYNQDMRVSMIFGLISAFSLALAAQQQPDPARDSNKLIRVASVPDSKIARKVPAVYPQEAIDAHVQGVVKLNLIVGKTGKVEHIKVVSGNKLLVPAATHAVSLWLFKPFGTDDNPARVMTTVEVPFTLDASGHPLTPSPTAAKPSAQ